MKYWRGYLIAAIIAACTWALREFAAAHSLLVDMIYPYVTRMVQTYLAQWSSGVTFCVWQAALLALVALALASIVLMVILKWNPIQWFGWILTAASLLFFLHTGLYGLNEFAGPLSDDLRLNDAEYSYTVSELEAAAAYYRTHANALANQLSRDEDTQASDFQTLAQQAAEGFEVLTYQKHYAVFAGSTLPVKELTFATNKNTTGITVALTGEAAVNPNIPEVCLPFAMCREMAYRMCIAIPRDADFAAFLACDANPSLEFQYAGYLMAYRACYEALEEVAASNGQTELLKKQKNAEGDRLQADLQAYDAYFGTASTLDSGFCDLLVVWHIQTVILPQQEIEEVAFDPLDESQVDLSGIVNARTDGE